MKYYTGLKSQMLFDIWWLIISGKIINEWDSIGKKKLPQVKARYDLSICPFTHSFAIKFLCIKFVCFTI